MVWATRRGKKDYQHFYDTHVSNVINFLIFHCFDSYFYIVESLSVMPFLIFHLFYHHNLHDHVMVQIYVMKLVHLRCFCHHLLMVQYMTFMTFFFATLVSHLALVGSSASIIPDHDSMDSILMQSPPDH